MLQLSKRMPAYIIYIFVEIPPKMSISSFVGYLKGKSSLMIFERFSHLKYNYGNRYFWCRGFYVDTVGRVTEVLDQEDPQAGHDVYLTIDINLQKSIYNAIEDEITDIFMKYFTPGSNKITYNGSGDVDTIYITAQEVN